MKSPTQGKALFVIGTLRKGGAEHQMVMLIEGLVHRGWKCAAFVLDGSGPLRARLDELNVPVQAMYYHGKLPRLGRIVSLGFAPLRLWWFAMRWRPDVLQAYLPLTNLIGAIAGRSAVTPLVITCRRGLGTHQERHPYWAIFDRIANKLSNVITCNSRAVGLDTVRRDGVAPTKMALIRNGVVFDAFDQVADVEGLREELGLDAGAIGIVTVGNLIPYKGHDDLLDAIAMLRSAARKYKVFVVGRDDGIGDELKRKARELGLDGKVVFLGARNDVPRLLAAMDLFLLPSHEEGSSNALLEAMASGLPIIATNVGGNAEALDNGRYGILVPAHDPPALAGAIETLWEDMRTWEIKGREAAAYVRARYSADAMIESHIALYREGASGNPDFALR
jgi:glycosyltransferase involved in cell wall biosynthesis